MLAKTLDNCTGDWKNYLTELRGLTSPSSFVNQGLIDAYPNPSQFYIKVIDLFVDRVNNFSLSHSVDTSELMIGNKEHFV